LAANEQVAAAVQNSGPYDIVYERYSLWSFAAMEFAASTSATAILEVNAPLVDEQADHRVLVDRAAAEAVARRVFSAADALIAVSPQLADYLNHEPAARGRVHVIPNGVNPRRFPDGLKPSFPNPARFFTVGFVGSMKPWHGLPSLIAAFDRIHQKHADTRLLIVGNGKAKNELQTTLASRDLLSEVHFTGSVDADQIPGLLASMDVAVAPYPPMQNFYFSPLKVYEYMAGGRAIVASNIGMLSTLIEDGVNGLLCPPGDLDALAEAVARLKHDGDLRIRLGQAARQTVLNTYTWERVVGQTLALRGWRRTGASLPLEAAS
ncbi:MAG TPA: glycosyltransferase family 4 protein, partial [Tepidisphaeraceae bacterium]|nr:glycosyltransferase family 4 protein [Tepidisphaeraceae bacterium]